MTPGATVLQGPGFTMRVEPLGTHLRAHVFDGVDSLAVSIAMWEMLAQQCRRHAARRLLVIEDLEGTVAMDDLVAVTDAIAGFGFAGIRIAFVELRSDIQGSEHGEILSLERNVTVMVFSQESLAKQWLLYGAR